MAPDPKSTNDNPEADPKEPTQEEVETAFFDKFETRLDAWFEKKVEKYRGTGTSRGSGRTTLQGLIADVMFGKPASKD